MMFLWDDVFLAPSSARLDGAAGSVGDQQQEVLMLLKVRVTMHALLAIAPSKLHTCLMPRRLNGGLLRPGTGHPSSVQRPFYAAM